MTKSRILKVLLIIAIVVLLGNALIASRDYEDSWVLEGLEVSFALFVTIYALTFFHEKKDSYMVMLAVIGGCVFLLIPNLKYVWFQGIYIDQHQQYALANHVYATGHIATEGPHFVALYGSTPFIHIDFAILSIVSSMPVVNSVKYLPVLLYPIYPLLIYVIIKNIKFLKGTAALRYALFLSSIPISPEKYYVTGSQFGVLLAFIVLSIVITLTSCVKSCKRRWFVFMFSIAVLAALHSSSSILIAVYLSVIWLFGKISYFRLKSYLKVPSVIASVAICFAWLVFSAKSTLEDILSAFTRALQGTTVVGAIPSRFFELTKIDIMAAFRSVLVLNGVDIFLLLLTFGGLLILLRMRKRLDDIPKYLFLIGGLSIILIPVGSLLKIGVFRIDDFLSPFFPIFSALFLLFAVRRRVYIRIFVISLIMFLAILCLYPCQPLIPPASSLSKDLPANEPILYVSSVNSIYQRQLIDFAKNHVRGRIASDRVTENQIAGLTDLTFSLTQVVSYYPLSKRHLEIEYDFFLIHLPGAAGGFEEQAEVRTRNLILEAIYNSSIIYTNGESYALCNTSS